MTVAVVPSIHFVPLAVTAGAWGVLEAVRFILEWRRDRLAGDATSAVVVLLTVVAALWVGVPLTRAHVLALPGSTTVHLWLGVVVLWLGIALRAWAVATLGTLYTTGVLIRPDHRLISSGPYAVLRHPSYTGLALALLGLTLAGGSGAAITTTAALLATGLGYRIRVEESALRVALGDAYTAYARGTSRVLPCIY